MSPKISTVPGTSVLGENSSLYISAEFHKSGTETNKKAQLTPRLARDSATTWRIRLK